MFLSLTKLRLEKLVSKCMLKFIVGRQNNDVNLISEVLKTSFATMVKSVAYILIAVAYLLYLNAKLVGFLFAGLAILTIFSGGFRRVTSLLN